MESTLPNLTARFGPAVRYPGSHGDLWTCAWADDDALYCASDDTRGFDQACNSNLAISRITGDMPPDIHGETINPMAEYGKLGETLPEDGAMWKACGLACLDGVLYLSVSRHIGAAVGSDRDRFFIQEAWDSSIVKSEDHGASWSPMPMLGKAMFPGPSFATPFFVSYGRDGRSGPDGSDSYVYAISSKGVWNNGDGMTLGRVRRDRIARLDAVDWEFAHGFDGDGTPIWRPRHDTAQLVFRSPGRASMTGVHYIEPLDLYLMPQWHYTSLGDDHRRWKATCIELYEAPAPWGPWRLFHAQSFEPEGWYNPCIPAKFISADGLRFWMFVAGDWTTAGSLDQYYGLFMIPVTLRVR